MIHMRDVRYFRRELVESGYLKAAKELGIQQPQEHSQKHYLNEIDFHAKVIENLYTALNPPVFDGEFPDYVNYVSSEVTNVLSLDLVQPVSIAYLLEEVSCELDRAIWLDRFQSLFLEYPVPFIISFEDFYERYFKGVFYVPDPLEEDRFKWQRQATYLMFLDYSDTVLDQISPQRLSQFVSFVYAYREFIQAFTQKMEEGVKAC